MKESFYGKNMNIDNVLAIIMIILMITNIGMAIMESRIDALKRRIEVLERNK